MKAIRSTSAVLVAILGFLPVAAQGAKNAPPRGKPAFEFVMKLDSLLDCHFYLKLHGPDSVKPNSPGAPVDLSSEVGIYANAQGAIQDPEAWRWFEGLLAQGPDVDTVEKRASEIPAEYNTERDKAGIKMISEGLATAYPKFMKAVWPTEQRLINRRLVPAKRLLFPVKDRISQVLMEKMDFEPVDAPATIFVVLRSGGVTSWGKTNQGYFTVIGSDGLSPQMLIESAVHEVTHIVDTLQGYNSTSVLKRVRDGLKDQDQSQVGIFLHGLIAYNAGALVRRFISPSYNPVGVYAPGQKDEYRPYLSTYEYPWNDYLDGKMSTKDIVAKLIEEFKAIQKLPGTLSKPAEPKKKSS